MTEELSAWQRYKQNLGPTRPWDMLNPNVEKISEEEAAARFDICKLCPELLPITHQCKKCSCFMKVKTQLKDAVCPLGKW